MLINGTFDWVYEEELDLRDGWRWSPDGQRIAYWQLNTDRVRELRPHQRHRLALLLRDAGAVPEGRRDELRGPRRRREPPAAATTVAALRGRPARALPRPHGVGGQLQPSSWCSGSTGCRTRSTLYIADATTGQLRTILTEQDSAWVDVVNDLTWLNGGKSFTWISERDGWNHVYLVSRNGQSVKLLTPGRLRRARCRQHRRQGRLGLLPRIARQPDAALPLARAARREGEGRAVTPGVARRASTCYNMSPDATPCVAHVLQHQHAADHRPGAPADPRVGAHRRDQREAARRRWRP